MDAQFLSAASSGSVKHVGLTSLPQELNPPPPAGGNKEKRIERKGGIGQLAD